MESARCSDFHTWHVGKQNDQHRETQSLNSHHSRPKRARKPKIHKCCFKKTERDISDTLEEIEIYFTGIAITSEFNIKSIYKPILKLQSLQERYVQIKQTPTRQDFSAKNKDRQID